MPHQGHQIERGTHAFDGVEVFGECRPRPGYALLQGLHFQPLDPREDVHEGLAVFGLTGGKGQAAVAHDQRRHPVPARRGKQRVPKDLSVVVGMDIDKPGGDGEAVGVDDLARVAADLTDGDDAPAVDGNIAAITLCAGPVIDPAVFHQQVVTHNNPPFSDCNSSTTEPPLYQPSTFTTGYRFRQTTDYCPQ